MYVRIISIISQCINFLTVKRNMKGLLVITVCKILETNARAPLAKPMQRLNHGLQNYLEYKFEGNQSTTVN